MTPNARDGRDTLIDVIRAGKGSAGVRWRARTPIAMIVAGCVTVVGLAVGGASKPLPGLDLVQTGHWIYNSALGKAFHIDGAGKRADAEVSVPGADKDSQVVQGPTQGYVVGPSKNIEFGKSTLSVEGSRPAPAPELPVTLEVRGGPYAVYRDAGTVIRLGEGDATIRAGGPLGDPVATADGRLWLHRLDSGLLCELAPGSERLSCPSVVPQGHKGSLTVAGDTAMFVDTTDDTFRPVTVAGLGAPVKLGVDVPETAVAASSDVDGRLAILDKQGAWLHLVDAAPKDRTHPVTVPLPQGDYAGVAASRTAVAVVDRTSKTLRTYDRDGRERESKPIPGEGGRPPVRGQDSRVYVDGVDGSHVLVVEHDGAVNQVPVTGVPAPVENPTPVAPPPQSPPDTPGPGTQPPPQPQAPPAGKPERPVPPQRTQQPPPVPASPPGAPRSVTATPGDGSATVKWNAAAANGAAVTGYRITWSGGEKTVGGGVRTTPITGLANGTAYVFTVAAINRAGTGPGASSAPVTPVDAKPPSAPGNVAAQPQGNGGALITWTPATANGSPITGYRIYWCPDSEGPNQPHDPPDCGEANVPASARQHVADFLLVGTELRFYVQAKSAAGNGPTGDDPTIPEGRPEIEVTQQNGMVRLVARTITDNENWNATLRVRVTGPGWEDETEIKLTGQHNTGTNLLRYPGAKGDQVTVTLYPKGYDPISETITWK